MVNSTVTPGGTGDGSRAIRSLDPTPRPSREPGPHGDGHRTRPDHLQRSRAATRDRLRGQGDHQEITAAGRSAGDATQTNFGYIQKRMSLYGPRPADRARGRSALDHPFEAGEHHSQFRCDSCGPARSCCCPATGRAHLAVRSRNGGNVDRHVVIVLRQSQRRSGQCVAQPRVCGRSSERARPVIPFHSLSATGLSLQSDTTVAPGS